VRPPPAPLVRYGEHPDQVANLHLPAAPAGPAPCVALVHGGFWRERWDRTLMTPLAVDIARRGLAAWNLEYRRPGAGGEWPQLLLDVAAGLDALADVAGVDADRVVVVGHSAGGQLALWAAARHRLPAGAPGAAPRLRPRGAIALAGVLDLDAAARDGIGAGAVDAFLGAVEPERTAVASPRALVPLGVRHLLVHGARDDAVPPSQSRRYAEAALQAGDPVELIEPDCDHFDVIDPAHTAWRTAAARIPALLGGAS
jgi:acetyl esterase/lipase